MAIVGDAVNAAEWVEPTGLIWLMLWSAVIALLLAKTRGPWFLFIPLGLLIGTVSVLWTASSTVGGENRIEQIREMAARLDIWWDAATGGGISTDLLPFAIMMLTFGWIAGFFSTWFIFRRNNVWVAVLLLGVAILTNLSFLPESFVPRFFVFVFFAMILVVRMSIVQKHELWRRLNIRFSITTGWLTLHATVWFSIAVVIVAVLLPMRVYTNDRAAEIWRTGRAPVAAAEDFFARLFASLPSKKDNPGRFFGKWLPFIGRISFGGEAVGWARTDYPSYWMQQTYNYYSPQGWIATETEHLETGPDVLPPPTVDSLKRIPKNQVMQVDFESDQILIGGDFSWVSHEGTIESLVPRKFRIDLIDPTQDAAYPQDIQELATEFRVDMRRHSVDLAHSKIADMLPQDLLVTDVEGDQSGFARTVTLQRKAPTAPDLVALNSNRPIQANEPYRTIAFVSIATNDELREAPTDYDRFFTDHYLQLPPELSQRVRDLSERVAGGEDNPFDKAIALQNYLRSPEFTYAQEIEAPPAGSDGVDWFLFESKTGYSDYFGSAMAVMLRVVGVPSRIAAGYGPGELDTFGQRVIRDLDSHGWVQVYFPGYGWIDFEPTPQFEQHQRAEATIGESFDETELGDLSGGGLDPLLDEFDPALDAFGGLRGRGLGGSLISFDPTKYVVPVATAIGSVAAVWLLWSFIWNFGLGPLGPEAKLYAKLTRIGWLAGMGRRPGQTPIEYGAFISAAVPGTATGATKISETYAVLRYAPKTPNEEVLDEDGQDEDGEDELSRAWKSIRLKLAGRVFRRLIPQSQQSGS